MHAHQTGLVISSVRRVFAVDVQVTDRVLLRACRTSPAMFRKETTWKARWAGLHHLCAAVVGTNQRDQPLGDSDGDGVLPRDAGHLSTAPRNPKSGCASSCTTSRPM